MNQYEFTLTFRLENVEDNPEKYIEALGAGGCDDALVGIGKLGSISLRFTRESKGAIKAVSTAIRDVRRAIPNAALVEASPDFVGMTDIADIYGASRQYIRKVATSPARSFPDPVHEGNPSLWHLADVLDWMSANEPGKLDEALFELAKLNMQINSYKTFVKASGSFMEVPNARALQVSEPVKGTREEAEWIALIQDAVGSSSVPASGNPAGRAR
jgi:hypothetical protein